MVLRVFCWVRNGSTGLLPGVVVFNEDGTGTLSTRWELIAAIGLVFQVNYYSTLDLSASHLNVQLKQHLTGAQSSARKCNPTTSMACSQQRVCTAAIVMLGACCIIRSWM